MTFVIISPDKSFWPESLDNSVFLGSWCYENEIPSNELIIDYSENTKKKFDEIYDLYEKILPVIADSLNLFHQLNFSIFQWRIIIGPWLILFISLSFSHFSRLSFLRKKFMNLSIIGLNNTSYKNIRNIHDFLYSTECDVYNSQIITEISRYLNISIQKEIIINKKNNDAEDYPIQDKFKKSLSWHLFFRIAHVFLRKKSIVLYNSYLSVKNELVLFILSLGKIVALEKVKPFSIKDCKKNATTRESFKNVLRNKLLKDNDYLFFLTDLISKEIPCSYLEGFTNLANDSQKFFGEIFPKKILTATAFFYDDLFKIWAAKSVTHKTKLYGIQHGGNYIMDCHWGKVHELKISDKYLTWGWKNSDKQIPISSSKLMDIKKHSYKNTTLEKNILFVSTACPKYPYSPGLIPENYLEYIDNIYKFFNSIKEENKNWFRFRPYSSESEYVKTISNIFIENKSSINFRQSLENCRLFMADHISTTWLEALSSNTPTILFTTSSITFFPKDFKYFEQLKNLKILHDTPEEASEWLQQIYPDINSWWNTKEVQLCVSDFCYNNARCISFPLLDWVNTVLFK